MIINFHHGKHERHNKQLEKNKEDISVICYCCLLNDSNGKKRYVDSSDKVICQKQHFHNNFSYYDQHKRREGNMMKQIFVLREQLRLYAKHDLAEL
ncbi:CLUMA_CG021602, isoform A [Clunio marinus]|uniref:CLUMA_CG021602, isoform A n=1 Tax=Clunio marinus TaxID=568069 RepID=A0A1J1JBS5_9DIPT|nr:CLUMA_CG021602, isoform A [Clunio marinus]